MNSDAIFWLQIVVGVAIFSLMAVWYVWPKLTKLSLHSALAPLLWVQVFRYVGMTLLVKGMIDPRLPHSLLVDGAYGDLIAGALAFAAIFALRYKWRFAIPLVWVANTWGFLDVLNVIRGVVVKNVPNYHLESIWFIYTFYAPLVVGFSSDDLCSSVQIWYLEQSGSSYLIEQRTGHLADTAGSRGGLPTKWRSGADGRSRDVGE